MHPPAAPTVAAALYGAWRLLRFDPDGLQAFRADAEAFWQSFFAAIIALPGYAILVGLHLGGQDTAADWASTVVLHGLAYVMSWTAFPLITYYASLNMDRAANWIGFVVALNWSKVLQMAIYLPLVLVANTGVFGQAGGGFLTLVGFVAVIVYQWFVTRAALDCPGASAAGLTAVDVILGLLITTMTDSAIAN